MLKKRLRWWNLNVFHYWDDQVTYFCVSTTIVWHTQHWRIWFIHVYSTYVSTFSYTQVLPSRNPTISHPFLPKKPWFLWPLSIDHQSLCIFASGGESWGFIMKNKVFVDPMPCQSKRNGWFLSPYYIYTYIYIIHIYIIYTYRYTYNIHNIYIYI